MTATHDLASTQALWRYNADVAIKVAEAFCLVEPDDFDGEVGIADLTTALKTWKGLEHTTYRLRRKRLRRQSANAVKWLSENAVLEKSKKGEKWRSPARERWSSDASLVAAAKCVTSKVFDIPFSHFSGKTAQAAELAGEVYQELANADSETTPIPRERLRAVIGMVLTLLSTVPYCDDVTMSLQKITNVG